MDLTNRRKIVVGSYPVFKAINYIPRPRGFQGPQGEAGTTFTPVYESLYANSQMLAETTTNVKFDTVGPSSRTALDITDGSITVTSPGVFTITFSTVLLISGDPPIRHVLVLLFFRLTEFLILLNRLNFTTMLIKVKSIRYQERISYC